jgi:hypothetical protein
MVLIILTNIKTYYYENIIVNNFILENVFQHFCDMFDIPIYD